MEGLKGPVQIPAPHRSVNPALSSRKLAAYFLEQSHSGLWDPDVGGSHWGAVLKTGIWLQRYWNLDKYLRLEVRDLEKPKHLKEMHI